VRSDPLTSKSQIRNPKSEGRRIASSSFGFGISDLGFAPGVPAVVPHEAAKRVIREAGLDHGRVHTTGYGLAPGFPPTWGEPLHLFGGSTYTLQAGMVVTVEPPVFLGDERLGARIIDNVLVTDDGAELLSRFSRDLIVIE